MFKKSGTRCKSIATAYCWIGIIMSVIAGIAFIAMGDVMNGLLIALLGSAASWLSSLGLYTIGETEERTAAMKAELSELRDQVLRLQNAPGRAKPPVPGSTPAPRMNPVAAPSNSGAAAAHEPSHSVPAEKKAPANPPAVRPDNKPMLGYVNCPSCGRRLSKDFLNSRHQCPQCGLALNDDGTPAE